MMLCLLAFSCRPNKQTPKHGQSSQTEAIVSIAYFTAAHVAVVVVVLASRRKQNEREREREREREKRVKHKQHKIGESKPQIRRSTGGSTRHAC